MRLELLFLISPGDEENKNISKKDLCMSEVKDFYEQAFYSYRLNISVSEADDYLRPFDIIE